MLQKQIIGLCCCLFLIFNNQKGVAAKKYNLIFVFADQLRAQDLGYNGNHDVITPHIDHLATESIDIQYAFSGCPVSCPYRGSLMTGRYPLSSGIFLNDVPLNPEMMSIGKVFKKNGYNTAYIGKWHLDGHGRKTFIPKERRHGFDYWKVLECTHEYLNSYYWDNEKGLKKWNGYDAFAQTDDACSYINEYSRKDKPFVLFLSFGPPHDPYDEVDVAYKKLYEGKRLKIRPNVPATKIKESVRALRGYYAHITSLDECIGKLQETIKKCQIDKNTIFVFTSDHGDMLFSHGVQNKQRPWEESIRVPFLIKHPVITEGYSSTVLLNTPDIMPTLLSFCGLSIPQDVEGNDLSKMILNLEKDTTDAVLLASYHAFGQWSKKYGGVEYRGIRTRRYTYVVTLQGDWMLYDNQKDPYQQSNLAFMPGYETIKKKMSVLLERELIKTNDSFMPGEYYVHQWKYKVDKFGTVPYRKFDIELNKYLTQ